MKIRFACPNCGKSHVVDSALAGKKGRCKDCGTVMPIPAAPQAVGAPARSAAVVDPFGLDDEPTSTASAPLPPRRGASTSDVETGPIPRRATAKSGKSKRRAGDGPWNLPLRNLAVQAIALSLIVSIVRVGLSSTPATLGAARYAMLIQGVVALVASALTIFSVVGATVSFARGNRKAFSCETLRERGLWLFAIGQTLIIVAVMAVVVRPGGLARMATFGRSLSTVQKAETSVYDGLVESVVVRTGELAGIYERFPNIDDAHMAQLLQQNAADRARCETTPLPTREQVQLLRIRHDMGVRMTMTRLANAGRTTIDRLRADGGGTPELQTTLGEIQTMVTFASNTASTLEKLGPDDDLAWYLTVTSSSAGSKAGDAPAFQPGGMPPEVRLQVDEARRHMEEFQRSSVQPPAGFPGPPPFPGPQPFPQ